MKLSHIFTLVVLLHLGVIGTLFIFPGCSTVDSTMEAIRPVGDRKDGPSGDPAHSQANAPTYGEASPDVAPQRVPPTRPTWNVSTDPHPQVLQGYDSI